MSSGPAAAAGGAALWTRDGRPRTSVFAALVGFGLLLIGIGWIEASGELRYDDQLIPLNVGIAGTAVVLGACTLYLVMFRRVIRGRTAQLRADELHIVESRG